MKRILCLFLTLILTFSASGCSSYYDLADEPMGNFTVGYSTALHTAFVSIYSWDGTKDAMTITVPDTYEELPITTLGGYVGRGFPCPFDIVFTEEATNTLCQNATDWTVSDYHYLSRWCLEKEYTTVYLSFEIHLGKHIGQLYNVSLNDFYISRYETDGVTQYTVYVPTYAFTCAEDNGVFYEKDGKLYRKKDGTLVLGITYPDFDLADELIKNPYVPEP